MSFAFFTDRKDTTNVNKSVPFYAILNAQPAYWYINIYFTIDLANISNHSNSVKLTFCPYIPLPTVLNNSFLFSWKYQITKVLYVTSSNMYMSSF